MQIKQILPIVLGLIVGLFVMMQVLTVGWNSVSNVYKYAMIGVVLYSFWTPKFGFIFLILASAYMDLFKRFLVVGGQFGYMDLIYIVGLPTLCSFACFAGCMVRHFFNPESSKEDSFRLFAACVLTSLVLLATVLSEGVRLSGIKQGAIAAGFAPMIFVVPYLYRDFGALRKLIKTLIWCFIPVALYTFWQYHNGFSAFEIAYLETGYSGEKRILQGQDYRYFSTLNSSQNLSKVMAMFGVLCFIPLVRKADRFRFLPAARAFLLGCMFFAAAYHSGSRTGLFMGVIFLVVYYLARSRRLMIVSYISAIIAFFTIIASSQYIAENNVLGTVQSFLYRNLPVSREDTRIFVLGTLNVRFVSMAEIANGNRLYPFGAKFAGEEEMIHDYTVHEALSQFLVRAGWVPLLIGAVVGGYVLWKYHKMVWALPKRSMASNYSIVGFGYFVCVAVGSMSAAANFQTYPITYFLYLFIGLSWAAIAIHQKERKTAQKKLKEAEESTQRRRPRMGISPARPELSRS